MKEGYLLTGALEPTNEWYAIAKIAGLKMVQAYRKQYGFCGITLMPANLYRPEDNFDLASAHVLPALMRKMHEARLLNSAEVAVWGSGDSRREFLHADDFASAALFLMLHYDQPEIINVGTGEDVAIRELAEMVQTITGFKGRLSLDTTMPDGTPRKVLDVSKLRSMGWQPSVKLEDGIRATYEWFQAGLS
jgi:GDP-L-fucose synthase